MARPRRRGPKGNGEESSEDSDVSENLARYDSVPLDVEECDIVIDAESKPNSLESPKQDFDVSAYSNGRNMSPTQERWNAITILPSALFCFYYLMESRWLSENDIRAGREGASNTASIEAMASTACIHSQLLPNVHALPPLPVVAVALGIILHCPCSFLYHWKYAVILPPGLKRIEHWSRRLDHSAIHLCSALWSYGTSGSWIYFCLNLAFNSDSVYRHFEAKVRPKRNQVRILLSMALYTAPLLWRDESALFGRVWSFFAVAVWLFTAYPLGGWSHSAFHVVMVFVPSLLLESACQLPESMEQRKVAAWCVSSDR